MKKVKLFCMGIVLILSFTGLSAQSVLATGGIPTVDGAVATLEIQSILKQLEEYTLQLEEYAAQLDQYYMQGQQYADQIKNTAAPVVYIWDQVDKKLAEIEALQSRLDYYYSRVENSDVESYADRMTNVDFWKSSDWDRLTNNDEIYDHYDSLNDAQLAANLDLMTTAQYFKESSSADAAQLIKLQQAAENAQGRMEAIQATNQLMANQTQIMLDMRNLMALQAAAVAQDLNNKQQKEAEALAAERAAFANWEPRKEDPIKILDAFEDE